MALPRNLFVLVLLVTFFISDSSEFIQTSNSISEVTNLDESPLHSLKKRQVAPVRYGYLIEVEVDTTDVTVIDRAGILLGNMSFSVGSNIQVTEIIISKVSPVQYEYLFIVEVNTTDVTVIDRARILIGDKFYFPGFNIQLTEISETDPATLTTSSPGNVVVALSFGIQRDFTSDLNIPESALYQTFKNDIEPALQITYRSVPGFLFASITGFRQGSVLADFTITTTFVPDRARIDSANTQVAAALGPTYPVIAGSFKTIVLSNAPLTYMPSTVYSGNTLTLTCGPTSGDNVNGLLPEALWKVNGRTITVLTGRYSTVNQGSVRQLIVTQTVTNDAGTYECIIKGSTQDFQQKADVTIVQAPVITAANKVNFQCVQGQTQPILCCVQLPYTVEWLNVPSVPSNGNCARYDYTSVNCSQTVPPITLTCSVKNPPTNKTTTLTVFNGQPLCTNDVKGDMYGNGQVGDISEIACNATEQGTKTAQCQANGKWLPLGNTCVLIAIQNLLILTQDLDAPTIPNFVGQLSNASLQYFEAIVGSTANIFSIVDILALVANVSSNVNDTVVTGFLTTVDVLLSDEAIQSWQTLNQNQTDSASSRLLNSLESFATKISGIVAVNTSRISLNRTRFNNSFQNDLNASVSLTIPSDSISNANITTILFSSLKNILLPRKSSFNISNNNTFNDTINGAVVLITVSQKINKVTLTFNKLNTSLTEDPQCVFWNFSLLQGLGAWDNTGCEVQPVVKDNTVTCQCNHLTSFSVLMSTNIPKSIIDLLDRITYAGVAISMASLVICLIIEAFVWKAMTRNSTAYMRHVSIVNIAVSLLVADIWFLIGAAISKNPYENPGADYRVPIPGCTAATFFIHFFYLALFFWMLVSGLLLFYRTVLVFSHMSKSTMLAIGFSLGYGGPLLIAVVTIASTAGGGGYIQEFNACWLNWSKTKALLAFVIPALTIVFINFLILIVVLYKMLRRGVGDSAQPDEKNAVVVIARCLAILTPFFGLTWALGVGTVVDSGNIAIHIAFAFFNSLQGFFILVFGTLLDSKIRALLARGVCTSGTGSHPISGTHPSSGTHGTRSTSAGVSSKSALDFFRRRRHRHVYHVSEAGNDSSPHGSETYTSS